MLNIVSEVRAGKCSSCINLSAIFIPCCPCIFLKSYGTKDLEKNAAASLVYVCLPKTRNLLTLFKRRYSSSPVRELNDVCNFRGCRLISVERILFLRRQGSSQRSQGVSGRYVLTVDVSVPLRLQKRRYAFDVFILLVFSSSRGSNKSESQVHKTRRSR